MQSSVSEHGQQWYITHEFIRTSSSRFSALPAIPLPSVTDPTINRFFGKRENYVARHPPQDPI